MPPAATLPSSTIFILCLSSILCVISPKVQNYTLTAIEYLTARQAGRFECIFFDVGGNGTYFDADFQALIGSPRLQHVAKFVINDSSRLSQHAGLPLSPALVVINVHANKVDFHTDQLEINPNTRILILFELDCLYSVIMSLRFFSVGTQFTRITCIESTELVFVRAGFDGSVQDFRSYLEPRELFVNLHHNMQGRFITYSSNIRIALENTKWMEETAKYLNGTPKYLKSPCDQRLGVLDDCYPNFMMSGEVIISMDCLVLTDISSNLYRASFEIIPATNGYAVPMSRSINVLEMFFWPFSLASWIVLALAIIAMELVNFFIPSLFRNDPTLLVICGFERSNLHQAPTRERLLFLSMIIFFFLMTNAYETRIISFMIDKPSLRKIETVQELIDSGLKLSVEKSLHIGLFNNSRFAGILNDVSHNPVDNLDFKTAYYGHLEYLEFRIQMPVNYDYRKRRPAYYILKETDGLRVCFNYVPFMDSLIEMFYYTKRIFFEAGLLNKWKQDDRHVYYTYQIWLQQRKDRNFAAFDDWLKFEDMLPAWMAYAAGSIGGSLVFFVELLVHRCFAIKL